MIDTEETETGETGDEALLKEIRDRFTYATDAWREIREERQIDMRYICGDPWDQADRKARENAGRPCINHDELNQYVNHAMNNARQNKRGIKVDPLTGTEKEAELRQDIIRTAEYRSRAQAAYLTAFQAMLEGSYGFFGVSRRYVENENITAANFEEQEIWFRTFANPDSVLPDPDCKEPDWSDQGYCFVLESITREEFKRQHPKAQFLDFSAEQMQVAKGWIDDRLILRAEYWKVITTQQKIYLLDNGKIVNRLSEGQKIKSERTKTVKRVVQYLTNGVEILKELPQPGTIIPIIPVTGLERYVDEGAGPKRKIFSLPRLARDPQMTLAYLCTLEAEEAGLTPKVPYKGYVGQFETDRVAWENITKQPRGFIQVDPVVDAATGEVLPLPVREQFTPNFQAYEVAKDSARRAIQAAMGISPLPTAAQRSNEKSGVALERIQQAQDVGSFHFVDNFDRALMLGGRIINEWIPVVYGSEDREMMLVRPDDTHRRVKLNTKEPYRDPKSNELEHFLIDDGSHTVTVSTGPSYDSQREAVSSFVDTLIASLPKLPIPPPTQAKILAIAIQMKQLGPKGDQLAELISPQQQGQIPPEAQAAIAHAQQLVQELQAEIKKLLDEKNAKVVDNEYRLAIEKLKIDAQLAIAEVNTKAQILNERVAFVEDVYKQLHGQAHEAGMQAADQAHQQGMATQQQQAATEQQQQAPESAGAEEPEPAQVS